MEFMEVHFTNVIDAVLLYHRERCIDMHVDADPDSRGKHYYKAEAAREIMMALGLTLLNKQENKAYKTVIQQRLGSVYESVFFDPATRKLIKKARGEEDNGGE